jgi:succinate dehydrogenase / fumarate reductase cytochrome b subunit
MATASNRPLSPHLQVWKWGPAMLTSILHRVSGNGLATVGLGLLLWWLAALAGGPQSYEAFQGWVWADLGKLEWFTGVGVFFTSAAKLLLKIMVIGSTWALFNHLVSGLRHFVMDIGAGYELKSNAAWSVFTPLAGVALTVLFWAAILLK